MINEETGIPMYGNFSAEQYIKSRSGSVKDKVRKMLQYDLIFKFIGFFGFIMCLLFYQDNLTLMYISTGGLLFIACMTAIQLKTLKAFNNISDAALSTRENLANTMVFLKRKSVIIAFTSASSQICFFVPGLLIYFYLAYGYLKPMTGMSFFVYTVLCLIGTIMSFLSTNSQLNFHIKQITLCLSDLNDDILTITSQTIEKQRKQDQTIKVLLGLLLIFLFVVIIAVLKSILS